MASLELEVASRLNTAIEQEAERLAARGLTPNQIYNVITDGVEFVLDHIEVTGGDLG